MSAPMFRSSTVTGNTDSSAVTISCVNSTYDALGSCSVNSSSCGSLRVRIEVQCCKFNIVCSSVPEQYSNWT